MSKKSFKSAPKLSETDDKSLQAFEESGIGHDQEGQNDQLADKLAPKKDLETKVISQKFKLNQFSTIFYAGICSAVVALLVAFVFLNNYNQNAVNSFDFEEIDGLYDEKFLQIEKSMRALELELVQVLQSQVEINRVPLVVSTLNVVDPIPEKQIIIDIAMDDTLRRFAIVLLKQAILSGESFQNEWENLYKLVSSDSSLQNQLNALMPYAAKGITTKFDLSNSLSNLALENSNLMNNSSDFYSDTINYFSYTVGLSSGVSISEQELRDMIIQTQQHIDDGDVQIAYDLVANSSSNNAEIFSAWLLNTKNQITAYAVLDKILSNQ